MAAAGQAVDAPATDGSGNPTTALAPPSTHVNSDTQSQSETSPATTSSASSSSGSSSSTVQVSDPFPIIHHHLEPLSARLAAENLAHLESSNLAGVDLDSEWGCPTCTFINCATARRCEMCFTPRPGLPPVSTALADFDSHPRRTGDDQYRVEGQGGIVTYGIKPKKRTPFDEESFKNLRLELSFFEALPSDLCRGVLEFLDMKDVLSLCRVCRWFRKAIKEHEDALWKRYFMQSYQDEDFMLLEDLGETGRHHTGWKRAFKQQFYLQALSDFCRVLHASPFFLFHCMVGHQRNGEGALQVVWDRSVSCVLGGLLSSFIRWDGEDFRFLADLPASADNASGETPNTEKVSEVRDEKQQTRSDRIDFEEDEADATEWDSRFAGLTTEREQYRAANQQEERYLPLRHPPWMNHQAGLRSFCETLVKRLYSTAPKGTDRGTEVRRRKKLIANFHERDRETARHLVVRMMTKSPPQALSPSPRAAPPFDSVQVAEEYCNAIFTLFESGREDGCYRCFSFSNAHELAAQPRVRQTVPTIIMQEMGLDDNEALQEVRKREEMEDSKSKGKEKEEDDSKGKGKEKEEDENDRKGKGKEKATEDAEQAKSGEQQQQVAQVQSEASANTQKDSAEQHAKTITPKYPEADFVSGVILVSMFRVVVLFSAHRFRRFGKSHRENLRCYLKDMALPKDASWSDDENYLGDSAACPGEEWECGVCTFINRPTLRKCEMCDSYRP